MRGSQAHSGAQTDNFEQRVCCGFGGSGPAFEDLAGPGSHFAGCVFVVQESMECGRYLFNLDDGDGIVSQQLFDDGAEVFVVRSHYDGDAELGGLEGIMASRYEEAAADKGQVGEGVDGGKFTDGIEEEDGAWGESGAGESIQRERRR